MLEWEKQTRKKQIKSPTLHKPEAWATPEVLRGGEAENLEKIRMRQEGGGKSETAPFAKKPQRDAAPY
jgi:hypothetical protein